MSSDVLTRIDENLERWVEERREDRERLKALEGCVREVEKRLNRRVLPAPTRGTGAIPDHKKEALGKWFLGCARKDFNLKREGLSMLGHTKAALQEDTASEGGELVPVEIADEVYKLADNIAVVRPLARVISQKSKTRSVPTLATEPSVAIVDEEGAFTQSEPTFGSANLVAKKIGALAIMSEEVLEDAIVDLGDFLFQLFAEKIVEMEDAQALEGDGAGSNFSGLFSVTGTASVSMGSATITAAKLIDTIHALPVEALRDPSLTWVMHPKVLRDIRKLEDTAGNPLLNPLQATGQVMIANTSVKITDQILTNRGAKTNETTVYVGAFRRGMLIGDRKRMQLAIDPWTKLDTAQLRVRVMERVAISVAVPGCFAKLTAVTV